MTAIPLLPAQESWIVDPKVVLLSAGNGVSGAPPFGHPIGVVRFADGTVVVADAHSGSLFVRHASSTRWSEVGRVGDGPGEFRHVYWLGRCDSSSVFVWDTMRRRMIIYSLEGTFIREYGLLRDDFSRGSKTVACSTTGVFVFHASGRGMQVPSARAPFVRGRGPTFIGDSHGRLTEFIDAVNGSEMVVLGGGAGPRPLGRVTNLAVASDRIYIGTGDSATIHVYALDKSELAPIRVAGVQRAPGLRNHRQAIDEMLNYIAPAAQEFVRASYAKIPIVDSVPAYTGLLLDPDEYLWVVLSLPGDPDTRLRVFDKAGRVITNVRLPIHMTVTDIGRDYILGYYSDRDNTPQIGLFRLRR